MSQCKRAATFLSFSVDLRISNALYVNESKPSVKPDIKPAPTINSVQIVKRISVKYNKYLNILISLTLYKDCTCSLKK